MNARRFRNLGVGLIAIALCLAPYDKLKAALADSWQQATPPSPERAQDQPFPPGSPFALLPGFKIERVTPQDQTESLIVITFDSLGRPVVSQSASGNGSSPRTLLDNNNDGIFESEKIVSDKLNTCHGLFFDGRTLYANCRGVVPGDPEPATPVSGAQPPPGGGRGGNQPPAIGIPGLYKLQDTNADDVMDTIERIQRPGFDRRAGCDRQDSGARAERRRRSARTDRLHLLTVRGLQISEDSQTVVLKTADQAEPITVQKSQIRTRTREKASIMPDDIADRVTDAGVRDVTAYVMRMIK